MNTNKSAQFLCAKIGSQWLGIDASMVLEIMKSDSGENPISSISGGEPTLSFQGKNIPTVSLSEMLLENHITYQQANRILISQLGDSVAGLIVDSVEEIIRMEPGQIKADGYQNPGFKSEIFEGIIDQDDKRVYIVSLKKLFELMYQS